MAKECSNTSCDKSSCEGCPSREGQGIPKEVSKTGSRIGRVIGIISGKGGVGKSFVTASLANMYQEKGFRVGILDADITGPSIPRMYGITGQAVGNDAGILPRLTKNGIEIMSVNLLLPDEDEPVVWRGPVLSGVVKQFWTDVCWGDLDYLFVDMPPGTGDVPLTVFQSLPVDGVVIVTTPQDLVSMIVTKAYKMAEMMGVPVYGIIENYSFIKCPDCGKEIPVFGQSHLAAIAETLRLPVLGRMPVDPEFAEKADTGSFHEIRNQYIEAAEGMLPGIN